MLTTTPELDIELIDPNDLRARLISINPSRVTGEPLLGFLKQGDELHTSVANMRFCLGTFSLNRLESRFRRR